MYLRTPLVFVAVMLATMTLFGTGDAKAFEFLFSGDTEYLDADNGGARVVGRCTIGRRAIAVYVPGQVRAPRYVIQTTPRKFVYRRRRVMVSPPHRVRRWVRAGYSWRYRRGHRVRVRVRHGHWASVRRPARYQWVSKRVLVRPAKYRAIRHAGRTGLVRRTIFVRRRHGATRYCG